MRDASSLNLLHAKLIVQAGYWYNWPWCRPILAYVDWYVQYVPVGTGFRVLTLLPIQKLIWLVVYLWYLTTSPLVKTLKRIHLRSRMFTFLTRQIVRWNDIISHLCLQNFTVLSTFVHCLNWRCLASHHRVNRICFIWLNLRNDKFLNRMYLVIYHLQYDLVFMTYPWPWNLITVELLLYKASF